MIFFKKKKPAAKPAAKAKVAAKPEPKPKPEPKSAPFPAMSHDRVLTAEGWQRRMAASTEKKPKA
jgi:hypothetical protein